MKKRRNARMLAFGLGVLLAICAVVLMAHVPSATDLPPVRVAAEVSVTPDPDNNQQHNESGEAGGKEKEDDVEPSLNENVLKQFEVTDASVSNADQSAAERRTFSMPENANYEGGVALFTVDPAASAEQVSEAIASVPGVVTRPITDEDLAMGFVKVELAEGVAVENAVNGLLAQDVVKTAQPNYVYYVDDLLEDEESTGGDQPLDTGYADAGSQGNEQESGNHDTSGGVQEESSTSSIVVQKQESEQTATTDGVQVVENVEGESEGDATQPSDATDGASIEAEAALTPNDPYYTNGNQWGLDSIKAPSAWGELPSGASGVTVAVLDMGFNVTHKDLSANMLAGYNSEADTTNTSVAPLYLKQDSSSWRHGTHVSGIIAAITNNALGVAGAANNYVKVLPIMMASWREDSLKAVATSESFQRAFRYVIDVAHSKNVRVINLSVGTDDEGLETWVEDYVQRAYNMGIVTVASSGNLGSSHKSAYAHYPSGLGECVAVMGMAQNGKKGDNSNFNTSVTDNKNVCAPGVGIYSTSLNDEYASLSGTSMATAFASSVVALEFVANPSLTAEQAVEILYGTSKDLGTAGWDLYTGYGEVDAYAAVRAAKRGGLTSSQRARLDEHAREMEEGQGQQEGQYDTAAANSLRYRTHVQSYGWQGWKSNGATSGTSGESKRLEAIEIKLTGEMANHYSVWYRVHAQTYGWLGWTRDGGRSGTATLGKRLEAIQVCILPKSASAPGSTTRPYVTRQVCYRTHVQSLGWQEWVYDGALSGTNGQSKRLEAINIKLPDALYSGGIRYRTHVQSYGWQSWEYDGALSGTSGESKRLEAIRIELYGEMADKYDVWYRVHAQTYGWLGWTSNGGDAGTAGLSKRLEAIQVQVLPKGSSAPGSTSNAFVQVG